MGPPSPPAGLSVWRLRVCPADLAPIQVDARSTRPNGTAEQTSALGSEPGFSPASGRCGLELQNLGAVAGSRRDYKKLSCVMYGG